MAKSGPVNDKLRSLGTSFCYLLVPVGSSAAALLVLALLGLRYDQSDVGTLSALLATVAAVRLLHRQDPDFYKALPTRKWMLYAVGLSLAATCLVQLAPYIAPDDAREVLRGSGFHDRPLADFAGIVLITPLAEELVFRGLILDALRRAFPNWGAAAISGAAFGIMHGNILWGFMAFCMSLLYAWLRLQTNSLYAPVAAHAVSNLLAWIMYYAIP